MEKGIHKHLYSLHSKICMGGFPNRDPPGQRPSLDRDPTLDRDHPDRDPPRQRFPDRPPPQEQRPPSQVTCVACWDRDSHCEQNHRCLWKHNLATTSLWVVKKMHSSKIRKMCATHTPSPYGQKEWHTPVKTLPFPKLYLQVVIISVVSRNVTFLEFTDIPNPHPSAHTHPLDTPTPPSGPGMPIPWKDIRPEIPTPLRTDWLTTVKTLPFPNFVG